MQKNCVQCQASFEITDEDLAFYDKVSPVFGGRKYQIPPPTHCPDCRQQRRLTFRNSWKLYRRKCDFSNKEIFSIYSPDTEYTVFEPDVWWSDQWDPLAYGREFDFSRLFFEQYQELLREVPLISVWLVQCENSDYNNNCFKLKNCYMCAGSDFGQNYLYCYVAEQCSDVTDCASIYASELCYECIDCIHVQECSFSQQLESCFDCHFSSDLVGCDRCLGCHGLRHKELYVFNKKVSEEEWNALWKEKNLTSKRIKELREKSQQVSMRVPKKHLRMTNCEGCLGDYLQGCKDTCYSYDLKDAESVKYATFSPVEAHHVYDAFAFGGVEWSYEVMAGGLGVSHSAFINYMANGLSDSYYCVLCVNASRNLFGCVGIKKGEYCIFNKQYSKEEYEELVPKIIEHMRSTGEWGEFFPSRISPFAYNETLAQEYFPLTKEEALAKGYKWRDEKDEVPDVAKIIPAEKLPESIGNVPDDILNWAIKCEATQRPFKIIKQELDFYRKMNLPIPHFHPDERHKRRMALRNPRNLWDRTCSKCNKDIQTTYAPERPEIVYCESCYLESVY